MGMRGKNPANGTWCRGDDRIDMRGIGRTRIDDGPFVAWPASHQIGVGARPGHHTAVVGRDPQHMR